MSNTKRPTVQRKHTRGTEAKRNEALDEGIRLVVAGEAYEVRAGDLTALDSRALRQQVGMTFPQVMEGMQSAPDIDLVAALMWLARRIKGERDLTYDDVAADVDYAKALDIEVGETGPEDTDSPEA
jgi:hypothetical protein